MMVSRVRDGGRGERELLTKVGEQTVSLVARSDLERSVGVATNEDYCIGMLVRELINSSF